MNNIYEKLEKIGHAIDDASDQANAEKIESCLDELSEIEKSIKQKDNKILFYYFRANAWASLYNFMYGSDSDSTWSWQLKEKEEEILNLRKSLNLIIESTSNLGSTDIKYRVKTNLANALNNVGRFAEALELWDEVLDDYPAFSMAHGNKGYGLSWYARALYDDGHQAIFLFQARRHLLTALEGELEEHAIIGFSQTLEEIENLANWDSYNCSYKQESLGRSKKEKKFRRWSLQNRLFLNPLNDTETLEIAANDILSFPSVVMSFDDKIEEGEIIPAYYGIYNQLKQDYISARYILFEGLKNLMSRKYISQIKRCFYTICWTTEHMVYGLKK